MLKDLREITRDEASRLKAMYKYERFKRVIFEWEGKFYDILGMTDEEAAVLFKELTAVKPC